MVKSVNKNGKSISKNSTINCRLCNESAKFVFSQKIMHKYTVSYYCCFKCDLLQTEEPSWLDEAYSEALSDIDTGVLHRNSFFLGAIKHILANKKGPFLDYAGGYGVFTRLARDFGLDFYWEDKFAKNLLSRGFESKSISTFEALTCFECFEHFVNPLDDCKLLLQKSNTIIFSTQLRTGIPSKSWWYYSFEHGQHVSLYSEKTLRFMAKRLRLKLTTFRNIHILSKKKVSKSKLIIAYMLGQSRLLFLLYPFMKYPMRDREELLK